jgi:hypothetical protein
MGFLRMKGFLMGLGERTTLSMWTMVALFCKSPHTGGQFNFKWEFACFLLCLLVWLLVLMTCLCGFLLLLFLLLFYFRSVCRLGFGFLVTSIYFLYFKNIFKKIKIFLFFFKLIFFIFLNYFNTLMLNGIII